MSVNTMTFEQVATVLQNVAEQATGVSAITPVDTGSFVSVAQAAINAGKDRVLNAISNVIGRTIFSVRPYFAKLTGLEKDTMQWGAIMRKLKIADKDWQEDSAYKYPVLFDATQQSNPLGDGGSVDQWTIRKPKILETNFVGQSVYMDWYTVTEDQLETAFTSPEEFGNFLSLITINLDSKYEQSKEVLKRGLVANAIGSLLDEDDPDRVIHLLTDYNNLTGLSLTTSSVYQPDNFSPFMKWCYARIQQVSDEFTARSVKYQTTINQTPIPQHTPRELQHLYMYSPARRQMDARVLADTFHDNMLRYGDVETLSFWQSIDTPDSINLTPAYTDTNGVLRSPNAPVEQSGIFAFLFDDAALAFSPQGERLVPTPVNGKGLYRNVFLHAKNRIMMDNTEKMAVFLLD